MSFGTSISPLTRTDSLDEIEMPITHAISYAIDHYRGFKTGCDPVTEFKIDNKTYNSSNSTHSQITLLSVEKIRHINAILGLNLPRELFRLDTSYEKKSSLNEVHLLAWAKREIAAVHRVIDDSLKIDIEEIKEGKFGTHYLYEQRRKAGYCYVVTLIVNDVRSAQAIKASFREPKTSLELSGGIKHIIENKVTRIEVQLYTHHLTAPELGPVGNNIDRLLDNIKDLNKALQLVEINPIKSKVVTTSNDQASGTAPEHNAIATLSNSLDEAPVDSAKNVGISSGVYLSYARLPSVLKSLQLSQREIDEAKLVKAICKEAMLLLDKYLSFYENSKFQIIRELKVLRNDIENYNAQLRVFYLNDNATDILANIRKKVMFACAQVEKKCTLLNDRLTEGRIYNMHHEHPEREKKWLGYGGINLFRRPMLSKGDCDTSDCRLFIVPSSERNDPIINSKSIVWINFFGYKLPGASLFLHHNKFFTPVLELKERSFEAMETESSRYIFKLNFNDQIRSDYKKSLALATEANLFNSKQPGFIKSWAIRLGLAKKSPYHFHTEYQAANGQTNTSLESNEETAGIWSPRKENLPSRESIPDGNAQHIPQGSGPETTGAAADHSQNDGTETKDPVAEAAKAESAGERELSGPGKGVCMVVNEARLRQEIRNGGSIYNFVEGHDLTFVKMTSVGSTLGPIKQVVFKNELKLMDPAKANAIESTFIFVLDEKDPLYLAYNGFISYKKMITHYLLGYDKGQVAPPAKPASRKVAVSQAEAAPQAGVSQGGVVPPVNANLDFIEIYIPGDGNCLFHSIIKGLARNHSAAVLDSSCSALRRRVSDILKFKPKDYFDRVKAAMANIFEEVWDNEVKLDPIKQFYDSLDSEIKNSYKDYRKERNRLSPINPSQKHILDTTNDKLNQILKEPCSKVKDLDDNWDEKFSKFMTDKGYAAYCDGIQDTLWGSELELEVIAKDLGIRIEVYKPTNANNRYPERYRMKSVVGSDGKEVYSILVVNPEAETVIHLLNVSDQHYNLLSITDVGKEHYNRIRARAAASPIAAVTATTAPDAAAVTATTAPDAAAGAAAVAPGAAAVTATTAPDAAADAAAIVTNLLFSEIIIPVDDKDCLFSSVIKGIVSNDGAFVHKGCCLALRRSVSDILRSKRHDYFYKVQTAMGDIFKKMEGGEVESAPVKEFYDSLESEIKENYKRYCAERDHLSPPMNSSQNLETTNSKLKQILEKPDPKIKKLDDKWAKEFSRFMRKKGYAAYCDGIRDALWGGKLELEVIAKALDICIKVYQPGNTNTTNSDRYMMKSVNNIVKEVNKILDVNLEAKTVIHLLNVSDQHYNLLGIIKDNGNVHYNHSIADTAAGEAIASGAAADSSWALPLFKNCCWPFKGTKHQQLST